MASRSFAEPNFFHLFHIVPFFCKNNDEQSIKPEGTTYPFPIISRESGSTRWLFLRVYQKAENFMWLVIGKDWNYCKWKHSRDSTAHLPRSPVVNTWPPGISIACLRVFRVPDWQQGTFSRLKKVKTTQTSILVYCCLALQISLQISRGTRIRLKVTEPNAKDLTIQR